MSLAHKRNRLAHREPPKLDSVRNEINVTPLVDVCLVLLIIFMVIMPMLERGREVPLPETRNHDEGEDTQQPIVALDKAGAFWVDKEKVPDIEAVKVAVQAEWKALEQRNNSQGKTDEGREGEGRVLVKGYRNSNYGDVYPLIIAMHDIGAVGIDLGTNEAKDKE